MSGIGIILNPHSKLYKNAPERLEQVGFIVGDRASCHTTQEVGDVEGLAREFKAKEIDILGISGGDGTNHCTLTSFIKVYQDKPLPKIAFLKGGTMNNIANAVGIKGVPERILSNLIYKYHAGEEFKMAFVDMIKVNGDYGFLWGMGLISRFIEEFYRGKKSPIRGALLLSKCLAGSFFHTKYMLRLCRKFDAAVHVDGSLWPYKNYVALYAGTVSTFGFGFRPFWRAGEKPEHFHLIGFSMPPRSVLWGFPWIFMGKKVPSENYLEAVTNDVTITLAEPQTHQIDGDLKPATDKITLKAGPRLEVIVS